VAVEGERVTKGNGANKPDEEEAAPEPLIKHVAPEPFPIDALGVVLAGGAKAIAAKVQCPLVMAAQSVLAAASLAVQGLADIRMPFGQTRPTSLFFVTVAETGARKSSADEEAMIPVRMHEKKLGEEYEKLKQAYAVERATWRAEHTRIERDSKLNRDSRRAKFEELGPEPEPPLEPKLTITEGTAEGLAKQMPLLPGALGIFSPEGSQFLNGYGFGPDAKLRTAASFSTLWDGKGFCRVRASSERLINLPGRRLAAHLMVQPGAAKDVLSDPVLHDQGLLSRILAAAPDSLAGTRMWQEPAASIEPALRRYIACMMAVFDKPQCFVNTRRNELNPHALVLSPEAREAWITFHNTVEGEKGPNGSFAKILGFAEKAAEQAARIAGVLAVVDDPDIILDEARREICADAMERGCLAIEWYLNETLRLAERHLVPEEIADAQEILNWLRARGLTTITARTLQNSGPNQTRHKERLDLAIEILIATRHFRPDETAVGKTRSWRVAQEKRP
jgi:hypothetical protein